MGSWGSLRFPILAHLDRSHGIVHLEVAAPAHIEGLEAGAVVEDGRQSSVGQVVADQLEVSELGHAARDPERTRVIIHALKGREPPLEDGPALVQPKGFQLWAGSAD